MLGVGGNVTQNDLVGVLLGKPNKKIIKWPVSNFGDCVLSPKLVATTVNKLLNRLISLSILMEDVKWVGGYPQVYLTVGSKVEQCNEEIISLYVYKTEFINGENCYIADSGESEAETDEDLNLLDSDFETATAPRKRANSNKVAQTLKLTRKS